MKKNCTYCNRLSSKLTKCSTCDENLCKNCLNFCSICDIVPLCSACEEEEFCGSCENTSCIDCRSECKICESEHCINCVKICNNQTEYK